MGTNISEIVEIGLSKVNKDVNVCPIINYDTKDGIKLDLDEECSWKWDKMNHIDHKVNEHGDQFYKHFHKECIGNSSTKVGNNTCKFTRLE